MPNQQIVEETKKSAKKINKIIKFLLLFIFFYALNGVIIGYAFGIGLARLSWQYMLIAPILGLNIMIVEAGFISIILGLIPTILYINLKENKKLRNIIIKIILIIYYLGLIFYSFTAGTSLF